MSKYDEVWPFEKLIAVLEDAVLLSGPIGFGPALPPDVKAPDFFRAIDYWGPIHGSDPRYPRLQFVWERMETLNQLLKEDEEKKHARS